MKKKKTFFNEIPTPYECEKAVLNLKENKFPGIDRIPNEFYETFWNEITIIF